MFDKLKDAKQQIKMIKEMKSMLGNADLSNPQKFIESLGIDIEDLNNHFNQMNEEYGDEPIKIDLKYINSSENKNPHYEYSSDSGFDLRASEEVWVQPNSRALIPTGIRLDISESYEVQIRSKSGLALNQGLFVLNSPGTIDSGYQGEIKVILFNTTNERVKIQKGQKIAQAVLCPVICGKFVNLIQVEKIEDKDRNSNGFGSTGL
jgi:dUTP pyrophosphatase